VEKERRQMVLPKLCNKVIHGETMKSKPFIHPNCPKKLAAAFHFARNAHGEGYKIHVLAEKIGVNVRYLQYMIKKGIEPNDTTEKLREVRVKMFLPARKRKPRAARTSTRGEVPAHRKWWRRLDSGSRDQYIRNTYDYIETVK
jgi:hypothetical protein